LGVCVKSFAQIRNHYRYLSLSSPFSLSEVLVPLRMRTSP
jgi:hypothetical protein